ncbi:hypothetical protein [Candidatus Pantoea persica]|uniref:hypothetical protein n=1 Tax=Candidatus Pantoea persica TaxID=2518128 RepID=UPI002867EB10|nr:hypothetical protein [Candidatus Pantoea persica]MBA2817714.1 putative glycosyltransferase EpsJ [Candidatus Pantoea persica]
MLNARRVRYTEQIFYRYYMHNASISNRKRNVEYQRHYLKIARMLEEINAHYRDKVKIYPSFHAQITHEVLSVCHCVRREPEPAAKQTMIEDIFSSKTHWRMLRNARGIKQLYQLLLCGSVASGAGVTNNRPAGFTPAGFALQSPY